MSSENRKEAVIRNVFGNAGLVVSKGELGGLRIAIGDNYFDLELDELTDAIEQVMAPSLPKKLDMVVSLEQARVIDRALHMAVKLLDAGILRAEEDVKQVWSDWRDLVLEAGGPDLEEA